MKSTVMAGLGLTGWSRTTSPGWMVAAPVVDSRALPSSYMWC